MYRHVTLFKDLRNWGGLPVLIAPLSCIICLYRSRGFPNLPPPTPTATLWGAGRSAPRGGRSAIFRTEGTYSKPWVRPRWRARCQIRWAMAVTASDLEWCLIAALTAFSFSMWTVGDLSSRCPFLPHMGGEGAFPSRVSDLFRRKCFPNMARLLRI